MQASSRHHMYPCASSYYSWVIAGVQPAPRARLCVAVAVMVRDCAVAPSTAPSIEHRRPRHRRPWLLVLPLHSLRLKLRVVLSLHGLRLKLRVRAANAAPVTAPMHGCGWLGG